MTSNSRHAGKGRGGGGAGQFSLLSERRTSSVLQKYEVVYRDSFVKGKSIQHAEALLGSIEASACLALLYETAFIADG